MAPICQKCGHAGFQEVLIYCRQCRIACEHKYCLYKFHKKGEKVRWYCEDCRPTIFPPSSPEKEVDAETCKLYPESTQQLQNHNPDLKNNNLDTFCPLQLETVRQGAAIIKSSPSDLCESKQFNKQRTSMTSNDQAMDQKSPNTQLNHLISPSASGNLTMHEVSLPETITHRDASNQNIEVCRPEPTVDFVWRGCISFGNEEFIPFRAHKSSQAGQRVFDAAKSMPPILPMDRYFRRERLQSIFKNGPPTSDRIGLYLLPDVYAKQERVSGLVDDIITKDFMFVSIFNDVELLVFPSCILPEEYHKLNGQYYLWGAFRNKQLQDTVTSTNHHPEQQLAMKIQDKNVNAVTVTSTFEENQKHALESKTKHAEDKADVDDILFGSPISEKLKCILARINEIHAQNKDDNSPCKQTTIEYIRAKHREEETSASRLSSRYTEVRKSRQARNKEENTFLNQQDRENSNYNTRSKTHGDGSRKRERSRYEDKVYNNLTKRQKALYDAKKKEQKNRDKTETEKHVDDSKKRKFREDSDSDSDSDSDFDSSSHVEKRRRLEEVTMMEKERSHGTTRSRYWAEKRRQEAKKDGTGDENSASPDSSVCNEEQKQRDANGICDNTQGQED